jgi:hypothetical protein
LITVTIPPLMKYPSVSLAASWTLSTLTIYKINIMWEQSLPKKKCGNAMWITSSELFRWSDTSAHKLRTIKCNNRSVKWWR